MTRIQCYFWTYAWSLIPKLTYNMNKNISNIIKSK